MDKACEFSFFSCHGMKAVIARDHSVCFYRQSCGQLICKDGLRWEIRIPRLIFFNVFIFNWRIINLHYCVGFCHTSTWISHSYTYVPSLLNLPPTPSHPSRLSESTGFELPASHSKFPLAIYFPYGNVYVLMLLSRFIPPSSFPTVPASLCSVSASPLLPSR